MENTAIKIIKVSLNNRPIKILMKNFKLCQN
jgi:hypothetical protein